jgi:hypothetical protein
MAVCSRDVESTPLCSNRAAAHTNNDERTRWVIRRNYPISGDSRTPANNDESLKPPLHGGGQGFESPRLHSRNIGASSCGVSEESSLDLFRGIGPLITIVVVGWMGAPAPRERQPRREASAQSLRTSRSLIGRAAVRRVYLLQPYCKQAKIN